MKSTILARFEAGRTFLLENARLDCPAQSLCYDIPEFLITAILLPLTRDPKDAVYLIRRFTYNISKAIVCREGLDWFHPALLHNSADV
jgi:hypothetical protein